MNSESVFSFELGALRRATAFLLRLWEPSAAIGLELAGRSLCKLMNLLQNSE